MIGPENTQSVNQNLPFSIDADAVDAEVGYLNGSKVTVSAVNPENVVGIQVSEKNYAGIPKNTRPVKIAFKDFREWLRNCRPVKALEHLLMGKGKRKLLTKNWMPVTQNIADQVIRGAGSPEKKEMLANKIKEFNTTLSSLAQKKRDHARLKLENNDFKAKYKTILAIVDGKLSSHDLRKNLVVALPPATEGGSPQYILLDSGSQRVRKTATEKLAEIFCASDAYNQFNLSKNRVHQIQQERKELKKSLELQANELKELHSSFVKMKVEDDRAIYGEEIKQKKQMAIDELKKCEDLYVKNIDEKIAVNAGNRDAYTDKAEKLKVEIKKSEDVLAEEVIKLSSCEKKLEAVNHIDSEFGPESSPMILNVAGIAQLQNTREGLKVRINEVQKNLIVLNDQLEGVQDDLDVVAQKDDELRIQKEEIRNFTAKEIAKEEKIFADLLAKNEKELAKNVKNDVKEVAAIVSGSPKKSKVVKPSDPIEPSAEG